MWGQLYKLFIYKYFRMNYHRRMTRIVSDNGRNVATNCGRAPLSRAVGAAVCLAAILALPGCSYIFSEKRTVYHYEPSYGVDSPEFLRSLDGLGTEMIPGNTARLLENGDRIFPEMLAAIARAERSINLEIYIFNQGVIATRFAAALAERARAGVEVRILVDAWGSTLGPLEPQLTAAGVIVRKYKPLKLYSIDNMGHRTHRRILTIDGRIGDSTCWLTPWRSMSARRTWQSQHWCDTVR